MKEIPDSKVHGANMGPTWVMSAPGGPHVGPMNLAIRDVCLVTTSRDVNAFRITDPLRRESTDVFPSQMASNATLW